MNSRIALIPAFMLLIGISNLHGADVRHDDHTGHDHGEAPTTVTPSPKKPHVHGAHEDHGDEHAHGDHQGHAESDEVQLPATTVARFGIVSQPVTKRALAAMILAPGWITYDPAGQAHITTPAAGRILRVHAHTGSTVKVGDPLIELSIPAFIETQQNYILKKAIATAAQFTLETANETLERGRQSGDGISGAELKRREAEAKQATVAKGLADAELAVALLAVQRMGAPDADVQALTTSGIIAKELILRAPISGTVIECYALPGQHITSDAPLIALADLSRLWAIANVPESLVAKATVGSLAELYAFNGDRLGDGEIAVATPDIDPHTRSGRVRLSIAGSSTIRPGMYVQVHITPLESETGPQVIAVPEEAVMSIDDRSVVFIAEPVGADVHFHVQPVVVGQAMHGYLPILSGLKAGTTVVVQGAFLLKADLGKEGAEHEH